MGDLPEALEKGCAAAGLMAISCIAAYVAYQLSMQIWPDWASILTATAVFAAVFITGHWYIFVRERSK